jgi:hypothetical protein
MKRYKFTTEDRYGNITEYPEDLSKEQADKILYNIAFGGCKLHVWVNTRTYSEEKTNE